MNGSGARLTSKEMSYSFSEVWEWHRAESRITEGEMEASDERALTLMAELGIEPEGWEDNFGKSAEFLVQGLFEVLALRAPDEFDLLIEAVSVLNKRVGDEE